MLCGLVLQHYGPSVPTAKNGKKDKVKQGANVIFLCLIEKKIAL